ncbi:MAG: HNH endonuclease [Clostridia bacterium]|nr:HNH endonuclease [Clostridia bacterium]
MDTKEKVIKVRRKQKHNLMLYRQWFLEKNGCVCAVCGKTFPKEELELSHICPLRMGGETVLENLQLVCRHCHIKTSYSWGITEYKFETFIKELLEKNSKYSNVKQEVRLSQSHIADITFDRRIGRKREQIVAELWVASSFTANNIFQIIEKMKRIREIQPKAKLLFVLHGELSQKYLDMLVSADIEVWDGKFLRKEFKEEISSLEIEKYAEIIYSLPEEEIVDEYEQLIQKLHECPSGTEYWGRYQKLVGEILEILFCPPLGKPRLQSSDNAKKNRRDFVLDNCVLDKSVWEYLRNEYAADYLVVDAKNSGVKVKKQDVLQIAHYLKKEGAGLFGIIISRKGEGESAREALRNIWIYEKKMVLVLDDENIEQMILDRKNGTDPTELLLKKIAEFRLGI